MNLPDTSMSTCISLRYNQTSGCLMPFMQSQVFLQSLSTQYVVDSENRASESANTHSREGHSTQSVPMYVPKATRLSLSQCVFGRRWAGRRQAVYLWWLWTTISGRDILRCRPLQSSAGQIWRTVVDSGAEVRVGAHAGAICQWAGRADNRI